MLRRAMSLRGMGTRLIFGVGVWCWMEGRGLVGAEGERRKLGEKVGLVRAREGEGIGVEREDVMMTTISNSLHIPGA